MLHTPNQGSQVADVAATIHNTIPGLRLLAGSNIFFQLLLSQLDDMVSRPGIRNLALAQSCLCICASRRPSRYLCRSQSIPLVEATRA